MTADYFVGVGADAVAAPVDFFAFFFFAFLAPVLAGAAGFAVAAGAADGAGVVP
ncbi:MAG: hypothetical protein IT521_09065 [Burkholderiales bacterium]|nr:hypothetical protein [Burkholderiales bacterium]